MALQILDENRTVGKHIEFVHEGTLDDDTKLFSVYALKDGFFLGEVEWFPDWKQFVFSPADNTVESPTCLRDIADFCEMQTKNKEKPA
jgi:hypothetical protein